MTIKRYYPDFIGTREDVVGMLPDDEGDYVEYTDHLALVAAAYRDAAGVMDTYLKNTRIGHASIVRALEGLAGWLRGNIRARTPADAQAALAAIERAAYERGVREAAAVCEDGKPDYICGGDEQARRILALLTQEGR